MVYSQKLNLFGFFFSLRPDARKGSTNFVFIEFIVELSEQGPCGKDEMTKDTIFRFPEAVSLHLAQDVGSSPRVYWHGRMTHAFNMATLRVYLRFGWDFDSC